MQIFYSEQQWSGTIGYDIIWGHLYLTYTKNVSTPWEALPNNEIFRRLADKMGFNNEQFKWSDEECLENYADGTLLHVREFRWIILENGFQIRDAKILELLKMVILY